MLWVLLWHWLILFQFLQLFDFMVGVSTGSIIVSLLAFKKLAVADVESIYNELGGQVFKQTYFGGITGMVTSHSYYDTASYQQIVQVHIL